jgi:hypothetical protein
VDGEADLAAAIHLGSLAIQLWQLYLRGDCRVGGGDVKLKVKLILDEVMDIPGR